MTTLRPNLSSDQRAILALWYEVNGSLSAYHKLVSHFGSATLAWQAKTGVWQEMGIHHTHLKRHDNSKQTQVDIDKIEQALLVGHYGLLFADQPDYPASLAQIYDPPPLLFYRGDSTLLQQPQIAIVGSRKPSTHAQKITFDIAQYLVQSGYIVTSGLAMGVDKCAHLGALTQADAQYQGRTIGVMGTGINISYPNHHDQLFTKIIEQGGCLISELLPHTPPHKHTFPRRNRLVAGLSLATIVTEATIKSGSLITARLTSEQGKQVFAVPSHIDNNNAEGCHHLIREGATLIYHPQQVLDDVSAQVHIPSNRTTREPTAHQANNSAAHSTDNTQNQSKSVATSITSKVNTKALIPEHLERVHEQLDWHGQDLDALLISTALTTPQLISQLMELELLGLISEQGGRYLRL